MAEPAYAPCHGSFAHATVQPFLLRKKGNVDAICTIGLFQNDKGLNYDSFWKYAADCN